MEKLKCSYNNKFKISAATWNDKIDLPDGWYSVSDIQDYFEYILKTHGENIDNPSLTISADKTKNIITFKIKKWIQSWAFSTWNNEITKKHWKENS